MPSMIRLEVDNDAAVATIMLDNPAKRNALDAQALRDLDRAYAEAETAGVRALVLRGEGRSFCSGRDISQVDAATDDVSGYLDGLLAPLMRRMSAFPAPTFAAVQGACLGVGLGLLVASDVVYVADDAKFGSPFAALGAALDSGGHSLFVERLGAHRTLDLIYTGRFMSGAEAVASGLFSRSMPPDELLPTTMDAASTAARGPTAAFVGSKNLIARMREERLVGWEALAAENAVQLELRETADFREGFTAFQEHRTPEFLGH